MATDTEKPRTIDLDDIEREILAQGLFQWGGPADPTAEVAHLIGFPSVDALWSEREDLIRRLREREPFTVGEWQRMLASLEVNFVSDRWGAGVEWHAVTGFSDDLTVATIRRIQRSVLNLITDR